MLGIVVLIAGSVIFSLAANGRHIITCGKWTGFTSYGDLSPDFVYVTPFLLAGGIGLAALGIFLLVFGQEDSKPFFSRID